MHRDALIDELFLNVGHKA